MLGKMTSDLRQQPRANLLLLFLLLVMAIFIIRLFYLQVIRHDYFMQAANANQVSKFVLPAERGEIYAKSHDEIVPLVLNRAAYLMFADPQIIEDPQAVKEAVRQVAGGDLIDDSLALLEDKDLRYVVLAHDLNREQAELLKDKELAGLGFKKTSKRVYVEDNLAATTLGFVNTEGEGRYGVEAGLNDKLSGLDGLLKTVTDVRNIPLTIGDQDISRPARNGQDVVLSIDRNIQAKAEAALVKGLKAVDATRGSVIVMDPDTGKVMAMANRPTFNPAKYGETNDYAAFTNDVVSSPYEPGSVMKTLSITAGIASGAIEPNSTFYNSNTIKVDGVPIHNTDVAPRLPNASVIDILHYSLNTGVVWTLKQMGGGEVNQTAREKLYHYYYDKYRMGQNTGIEIAGEQSGTILKPNQGYGRNVRYANMMFGQAMDVTMVQFAAAFAATINGGTYYQPSVIAGKVNDSGEVDPKPAKVLEEQMISRQDSLDTRNLIWKSREAGHFGDQEPEGYKVGGKTGTSQKIDPETGKYSDTLTSGSYVGFGGTDNPEYVIMVRVMDPHVPGFAGTEAAGPIFYDISNWMIKYLQLPPNPELR